MQCTTAIAVGWSSPSQRGSTTAGTVGRYSVPGEFQREGGREGERERERGGGGWVGGRAGGREGGRESRVMYVGGKERRAGTVVVASNDSPPHLPDAVTMRAKSRG